MNDQPTDPVEVRYPDPAGMPDDERMTPAEFRVIREYLGLTGDWLAAHLGVSGRTVRHWEAGKYPIPDGVRLAIERFEWETASLVGLLVEGLNRTGDRVIVTYRSDEEYQSVESRPARLASWHRAVVARVAQEVPGL